MTKLFIPSRIIDDRLTIQKPSIEFWPLVKALTPVNLDSLLSFLFWGPEQACFFTEERLYKDSLVPYLTKLDAESRTHLFFIHCLKTDEFVGIVKAEQMEIPERTIAISYGIFPEKRNQGFASAAASLLSQTLLDQGARFVVAECKPENIYSARALLRADFTEMPEGLTTTSNPNIVGPISRRFIKFSTKLPKEWPIPEPNH